MTQKQLSRVRALNREGKATSEERELAGTLANLRSGANGIRRTLDHIERYGPDRKGMEALRLHQQVLRDDVAFLRKLYREDPEYLAACRPLSTVLEGEA